MARQQGSVLIAVHSDVRPMSVIHRRVVGANGFKNTKAVLQ